MPLAPLFVKYKTAEGNHYFYEPSTNEIVRVDEATYKVLDDFHVLNTEELVAKHRSLGEEDVRRVVAELEQLQSNGILSDHSPAMTYSGETVACQGKVESTEVPTLRVAVLSFFLSLFFLWRSNLTDTGHMFVISVIWVRD